MTFAPLTLRDLGAYWTQRGGTNLGIVGDLKHCGGYHLGRDRIYGSCACRPEGECVPGRRQNDYSVKHPRDVAGLSDAASAIDLGRLGGTLPNLYTFSRWLVNQCIDNEPGTSDIREVIYSPDGQSIRRWDAPTRKVYVGGDGTGQGDNSHRWHTHISYFRDSEQRDKRDVFRAFFDPPDTDTEEPVGLKLRLHATTDSTPLDAFGTAKQKSGDAYRIVRVSDIGFVNLPDASDLGIVQRGTLEPTLEEQRGRPPLTGLPAGARSEVVVFTHAGETHVALLTDVVFTPLPVPKDTTPFGQADIDAATAPLKATITALEGRIETAKGKARLTVSDAQATVTALGG